jgi:hypothetical protein
MLPICILNRIKKCFKYSTLSLEKKQVYILLNLGQIILCFDALTESRDIDYTVLEFLNNPRGLGTK